MKTIFLFIYCFFYFSVSVYPAGNTFGVFYPEASSGISATYPFLVDASGLRFDFNVRVSDNYIVVPDVNGPDPGYEDLKPVGSIGTARRLPSGPILSIDTLVQIGKTRCRFRYNGFVDNGSQVESLVCRYGGESYVTFKPQKPSGVIDGVIAVRYTIIRIDGSANPFQEEDQVMYLYYRRGTEIKDRLYGGTLPAIEWVGSYPFTCRIEPGPPSGGDGTYVYDWEVYTSSGWSVLPGIKTSFCDLRVSSDMQFVRRRVRSQNQVAYTNPMEFRLGLLSNRNYIAHVTSMPAGHQASGTCYAADITYYDGLGRAEQLVNQYASPAGGDIVTPVHYDNAGRSDSRTYLPYVRVLSWGPGTSSVYDPNAFSNQLRFHNFESAYRSKTYESLSSSRLLSEQQIGRVYVDAGKKIDYIYSVNGNQEVFRLKLTADGGFQVNGYYPRGQLYKISCRNEDGRLTETFTNVSGEVILVRQKFDGTQADLYRVYDAAGRLCVVISPEGSGKLSSGLTVARTDVIADRYCYLYTYDGLGRQVVKKMPGTGEIHYVYNSAGQVVMMQDARLRSALRWKKNVYDVYGRLTEEKMITLAAYRPSLQAALDAGTAAPTIPVAETLLASYRYDRNLVASPSPGFSTGGPISVKEVGGTRLRSENKLSPVRDISSVTSLAGYNANPCGQKTWEKIAIVEGDTVITGYMERTYYYDWEGRLGYIAESGPEEIGRTLTYSYDFTGALIRCLEQLELGRQSFSLETFYSYDTRGRLLRSEVWLNDAVRGLLCCSYDNLGRLSGRTYGNNVCSENLSYNLQGWLTGISSPFFSMNLQYYKPAMNGSKALYAGDISEWSWKQGSDPLRTYSFHYDGLGRLAKARAFTGNMCDDAYTERGLTYDRNGNFKTLQRTNGNGLTVDSLTYGYTGNLLTSLTENAATLPGDVYVRGAQPVGNYTYDGNGNLLTDSRRALNYRYNYLNLLEQVKSGATEKVRYCYTAGGEKLGVRGNDGKGYDYRGSFILTRNGSSLSLSGVLFDGGQIVVGGGNQEVYYYLRDHLGSVRVIIDSLGRVKERNDYYPFGLRQKRSGYALSTVNRFKYNGKEEQTIGDLGHLDYGARMYDAVLGRWFTVDPLSEKYYGLSPYNYAGNNPIRYIDYKGFGPKDRIKAARSMTGIGYKQETGLLRTANTAAAKEFMDCSEFVCRVLAADEITDGVVAKNSSALYEFFSNEEQFIHSEDEPLEGDIAVWAGHVGVVTGVNGVGEIKLTHARGINKPSMENPGFTTPSGYRNSKFYGYYRPKQETRDGKLDDYENPLPESASEVRDVAADWASVYEKLKEFMQSLIDQFKTNN